MLWTNAVRPSHRVAESLARGSRGGRHV